VAELRELDPEFTLDEWKRDVVEHTLPKIMEWLLKGKTNQLKPWLGEGVFKRIAAENKARQQEGVQIDTTVLGIMNSEILACEVRLLEFTKSNYDSKLTTVPSNSSATKSTRDHPLYCYISCASRSIA
jgi:hypothetical protein